VLSEQEVGSVLRQVQRASGDRRPVVLIDGGSGSGKSTLARALAPRLDAQLVHLDDLYPGWDGLRAGSEHVRAHVLAEARWRRWDWTSSAPGQWHRLDPTRALVVEGSGALSRANQALATFAIWIDCPPGLRYRRAMARDGEAYRPHWGRWARQERQFHSEERPDQLADLVLSTAGTAWSITHTAPASATPSYATTARPRAGEETP
jgi:gluconate kinase